MSTDTSERASGAPDRLSAPEPRETGGCGASGWTRVPSPVGELYVAFTERGICYVRIADSLPGGVSEFREAYRRRFARPLGSAEQPPTGLLPALHGGDPQSPLFDLRGLSEFQRATLEITRRIPAGETRSYGWVAREMGRPRAARAVGAALGRNPVPVLIPCHRVVRADGTLHGYTSGVDTKERLLRAEGVNQDELRRRADTG